MTETSGRCSKPTYDASRANASKARKSIRHPRDLAVNGAPPAFDQPVHVGRPNIATRSCFLEHINGMLDRCWLTNNGPLVQELEQRIARTAHVRHCIAMSNGTIALQVAIQALGLKGEVILPSYTFIATAHALQWLGVTPVFADIDPSTHNLDPASVRRMISARTSAILGVHLWGRAAPIAELQSIAREYDLCLLFDAAHAFGCSYAGRPIGGFGSCEVFSFHATKFFNTLEGGAIVTDDDELAEKAGLLRNFGFAGLDNVVALGINGKMSEAHAAMGLANLDEIDDFININRINYHSYRETISDIKGFSLLRYNETERNNFQYIVIEVTQECGASRDQIILALHSENVLARKYFWPGCHRMKPYCELFPEAAGNLSNTRLVADRVIVLPTGTAVGHREIETVCDLLRVMAAAD